MNYWIVRKLMQAHGFKIKIELMIWISINQNKLHYSQYISADVLVTVWKSYSE